MSPLPPVERYGPWALVVGASEGIGAAFSHALARRGLNVAMVARRAGPLEAAAATVRAETGVETLVIPADLSDPAAPAALMSALAEREVGLLVYNAALSVAGRFHDVDVARHQKAIQVNCAGPVALVHALGAAMRARGRGGIVLVSSLSGDYGTAHLATYAATKAFNTNLAEGLWVELRPEGVDVLAVCAGAVATPGYARRAPEKLPALAPKPMDPAAVAEAALRALGRRPRIVPGRANRVASFFLRAFVPRRRALRILGEAGRAIHDAERRRS